MMRILIVVHRWIGITLCLLFAVWFASGMVMMYVPFPSLPEAERLARSPPVDLSELDRPLVRILDRLEGVTIDRARLIAFDQRPVLVIESTDHPTAAFYADTHLPVEPLTSDHARRIAERFSRSPVLSTQGPLDFDQWVVHQAFDRYRPFFRVALADTAGTTLYVSQVTGEILQRTNRHQRTWNYLGAVVHWIYPTFIRKHWTLWDQLVWWLSLVGIVGALLGLTLGIVHLRIAWRRGRRGLTSPFIGWMGWHHKLGLVFGVIVTTWIFSGWLSMDHGRLFSVPEPTAAQVASFRGLTIRDAVSRVSIEMMQGFSGAREVEISAVAGQPAVITRYPARQTLRIIPTDGASPRALLERDIETAIGAAWPDSQILRIYRVPENDPYTHLREGSLGSNTLRIVLGDAGGSWIHVDPSNGRIISVMDRTRRVYRWLFNGLHSFDFPGLVNRRPLWDVIMLGLLTCGFVFSITAIVIGYRRILGNR